MADIQITLLAVNQVNGDCQIKFKLLPNGGEITNWVHGLPTNDTSNPVDTFVNAAKEYTAGYYRGLTAATPQAVHANVTALIGQSTTVTV